MHFTLETLDQAKSRDLICIPCTYCAQDTLKRKNNVLTQLKSSQNFYCSVICKGKADHLLFSVEVSCRNCNKLFRKQLSQFKQTPNSFCSRSCAASFNNKNKTKGTRRSKLEAWIESKLQTQYPDLEILFNHKEIINSELDIYIPELKLAFELNGIFHYEPIYGSEKFKKIQQNDENKFGLCKDKQISLCVIDTSSQGRFTEKSSQLFLEIITRIIRENLDLMTEQGSNLHKLHQSPHSK